MPPRTKPTEGEYLARALGNTLISPNEADSNGEPANVVDGLFAIARAIRYLADRLGTGDAATGMGGLEVLAKEVRDGFQELAEAVRAGKEP